MEIRNRWLLKLDIDLKFITLLGFIYFLFNESNVPLNHIELLRTFDLSYFKDWLLLNFQVWLLLKQDRICLQ